MPYIPGGDLYKWFKKFCLLPELIVKFYSLQVVFAIGHLHEKDYAYRDIKLENIIIDKDGYIKLIDFGMVKKIQHGTKANTVCGTIEYCAPEVLI